MNAVVTAQLVTGALVIAIWRRGKLTRRCSIPIAAAQYACEQFQQLMADHGVVCSISRSGNSWTTALTHAPDADQFILAQSGRALLCLHHRAQDQARQLSTTFSALSNAFALTMRRRCKKMPHEPNFWFRKLKDFLLPPTGG
jgi:transposase InsO family protein